MATSSSRSPSTSPTATDPRNEARLPPLAHAEAIMLVTRMKRLSYGALVMASLLGCARASAKEPPQPTIEPTIKVTAKKFEFSPDTIKLKRGVAVTLELTALDRKHGFVVPELGIRADVEPRKTTRL